MATRMKTTREKPWHYTECGLDNVCLVGIEVETDPKTGGREPIIPQIADLHDCIFLAVLGASKPLTGSEVRFVRRHLPWTQTTAAENMRLSSPQYWCALERKGDRRAFSDLSSDLVWRLLCLEAFAETAKGQRKKQARTLHASLTQVSKGLDEISRSPTSHAVEIRRVHAGKAETWQPLRFLPLAA